MMVDRLSASCFQLLGFSLLGFMVTLKDVRKGLSFNMHKVVETVVEFIVCDYCSVSPYLPVKMTCFIRNTDSLSQYLNLCWQAFHSEGHLMNFKADLCIQNLITQ